MNEWVEGTENLVDARRAYAAANGLSPRVGAPYRAPGAPWRLVWHTMEAPEDNPATPTDEGWDLDQARSYIIRHRTPPHLWALPLHDHVFQTVPLTLASYALRHEAGDPETNHAHAIQVEVLGYAANGLDGDVCDWLGERVLRPVLDAGVPIDVSVTAPTAGANGYGLNGAVRMSWTEWAGFNGVCGHANVPGNQHWDPGRADYHRIAAAARPAPQENDDMAFPVIAVNNDPTRTRWLALTPEGAVHVPNPEYYSVCVDVGLFKPVKYVSKRAYDVAKDMANRIDPEHAGAHDVFAWYAAVGERGEETPLHKIVRQVIDKENR